MSKYMNLKCVVIIQLHSIKFGLPELLYLNKNNTLLAECKILYCKLYFESIFYTL